MKECGAYYLAQRGKPKEAKQINVKIVKNEKPNDMNVGSSANLADGRLISPSSSDLINTSESGQVADMLTSLLLVTNDLQSYTQPIVDATISVPMEDVQSTENHIPSPYSTEQGMLTDAGNITNTLDTSKGSVNQLLEPAHVKTETVPIVSHSGFESATAKKEITELGNSGHQDAHEIDSMPANCEKEIAQSNTKKPMKKSQVEDSGTAPFQIAPPPDGTAVSSTKEIESRTTKGTKPRDRSKRNARNSNTKVKMRCSRDKSKDGKKEGT